MLQAIKFRLQTSNEPDAVLRRHWRQTGVYRATLNDKPGNNAMPGCAVVKTQPRQVQKVPRMPLRKMGEQINLDVAKSLDSIGTKTGVFEDLAAMVNAIVVMSKPGDQILVMSNGGFGGVHGKILAALAERELKSK